VRFAAERETLGRFFSGHPIEQFERDLPRLGASRIGDLAGEPPPTAGVGARYTGGRQVAVAGLIDEVRKRNGRTSLLLDDDSGRMEVTLFEEQAAQYRELLVRDALVLVEGALRFDDFSNAWRVAAKRLTPLESLREKQARRLVLRWPEQAQGEADGFIQRLQSVLQASRPGPCEVLVRYRSGQARCTLALGADWAIRPTPALTDELEALVGSDGIQWLYDLPAGAAFPAAGSLQGSASAH
jgi:DNA polymerase-3 subunit alpha